MQWPWQQTRPACQPSWAEFSAAASGEYSSGGSLLAQAFALEFDPVRVVDDPIQDGIGQRRIADDLVPAVDRHLAGDDQRAGVVAVLDDFQQIALLLGQQRLGPPIVQDQQLHAAQRPHHPGVTAVTARQRQIGEHARDSLIQYGVIVAAGPVPMARQSG